MNFQKLKNNLAFKVFIAYLIVLLVAIVVHLTFYFIKKNTSRKDLPDMNWKEYGKKIGTVAMVAAVIFMTYYIGRVSGNS
jgi:uncharacterized membrane protein